jgi:hypothetical protein
MGGSEVDDRFVTHKDGMVVPAPAYCLLLDLERRDFSITGEGDMLMVHPPERLTREDCTRIRRWKWHLLMLIDYCARPDRDAHLFRDDTATAPTDA